MADNHSLFIMHCDRLLAFLWLIRLCSLILVVFVSVWLELTQHFLQFPYVFLSILWICGDIFLTQLYYRDGKWADCIQKPKQRISFSCTISMYHAVELRKSMMKLPTVIWSHKLGVLIALNFDSQHNTMHIPYYMMFMMSACHILPSSVKSAGYFWVPKSSFIYQFY